MADHSSNHRADSSVVQDDDPFAELTRIMGHDPRRGDTSAAEIDQGGDDLALELENELLGDLADFSDSIGSESVDNASARFGDQPVHQSNDWRFDVEPQTAVATKGDIEPSVDLAADIAEELDKGFESALRLEPAEELTSSPSEQAQELDGQPPTDDPGNANEGASASPQATAADAVFEFDEQDFAQLDADLDATISSENTDSLNEQNPDGVAPFGGSDLPEAGPQSRAGEMVSSSEFDWGEPAEDVNASEPSPTSADPYLSPQAFASSVANGGSGLSAGDEPDANDDHGFAASLEEELSAGASADEEVAVDAMAPQRDAKTDSEFSWDPFDVAKPQDTTTTDASPAETGGSVPFWREPDRTVPASSGVAQENPPFVDTVSVPGNERVQVEDAHHIPEFVSEPQRLPDAEPDDLEKALARAFGDNESLPEPEPFGAEDDLSSPMPNDAYANAALGPKASKDDEYDFDAAFSDSFGSSETGNDSDITGASLLDAEPGNGQFVSADSPEWESGAFDAENDAVGFSGDAAIAPPTGRSRGAGGRNKLIVGALGGAVVLGLVGFFALGGDGGSGSAPVVVRADDDPVKVKPENPGGQQVPNQDNQVYQRVSGSQAGDNPVQERLVSTAEEPVEVPKSEERLSPNAGESAAPTTEPVTAMTPRRVRTMVVRPDGTIVPRETAEAPAASDSAVRETAASNSPAPDANTQQALNTASPDARLRGAEEPVAPTADTGAPASGVPQTAPVPATRPASPPVQRQPQPAAETTPAARVAAAPSQPTQPVAQPQTPAAAPVTTGGGDGWSVQISSQPTVDAAQKSYQDMARRYGSLLTGKGVNIVKADIAGKGTYYRVRIPSSSKDEAIRLCSQLKSAGGSCFVSK